MIEKFAGYGFNKIHSHRLRPDRLHDGLSEGPLPGRVHGGAACRATSTGRNFKRKDSLVEHLEDCRRMDIEVVPPDVNRSDADFTVADGKILLRPVARSRAAAARRREAIVAARKQGGPFRRPVRFLRAGRSARCEPGDDRNADQGRRVRLASARSGRSLLAVARPGHAVRRVASPPIAGAARRACSAASTTRQPPPRRRAARRARVGRQREGCATEKEVLGFYLTSHPLAEHEATLGDLSARTRRPTSPRLAGPHRSAPGRHALGDQVLATPRTRGPASRTKYANVRPGRHGRHRPLHPLARAVRRVRPAGQGRPILVVRGAHRPPRQRRGEPDRQRADPARPARLALHQRRRHPRRRDASTAGRAATRSARSSAAIPATASCNSASAWKTAAACSSKSHTRQGQQSPASSATGSTTCSAPATCSSSPRRRGQHWHSPSSAAVSESGGEIGGHTVCLLRRLLQIPLLNLRRHRPQAVVAHAGPGNVGEDVEGPPAVPGRSRLPSEDEAGGKLGLGGGSTAWSSSPGIIRRTSPASTVIKATVTPPPSTNSTS